MNTISPCLWFDGQAEEAAELYVGIFEDAKVLDVLRYGSVGPGQEGSVMTVSFQLRGQEFLALNGGPQFQFTEAVSLQVFCDTQDEVDYFWEKLSEGGEEGPCGWLKDRYGLSWQVIPNVLNELIADPDPERSQRAMAAMLTMGKFDIADLERAAVGS